MQCLRLADCAWHLIEYFSHDLPMPWTLDADYGAVRAERYKLIERVQHPDLWELYDPREDHYETVNLAGTRRGAALRPRLSRSCCSS